MHLHPVLNDCDIYGHGKPTRIANSERDLRQPPGSLPLSEKTGAMCFRVQHFKEYDKEAIEQAAAAFRKVAQNADQLL